MGSMYNNFCLSGDIFSVDVLLTTVTILFLLSLVWLTETATTLLNVNKATVVANGSPSQGREGDEAAAL